MIGDGQHGRAPGGQGVSWVANRVEARLRRMGVCCAHTRPITTGVLAGADRCDPAARGWPPAPSRSGTAHRGRSDAGAVRLGGVGKTQWAAEFARSRAEQVDLLLRKPGTVQRISEIDGDRPGGRHRRPVIIGQRVGWKQFRKATTTVDDTGSVTGTGVAAVEDERTGLGQRQRQIAQIGGQLVGVSHPLAARVGSFAAK